MADEAGEKMLTAKRLAVLTDWGGRGGEMSHNDVRDLLSHIAALSATIKRLEIPVSEGEVEAIARSLEEGWIEAYSRLPRAIAEDLSKTMQRAAGFCRRQAREIERLKAALGPFAEAAFSYGETSGDTEKEKATFVDYDATFSVFHLREARAALSLNSVETREMKP